MAKQPFFAVGVIVVVLCLSAACSRANKADQTAALDKLDAVTTACDELRSELRKVSERLQTIPKDTNRELGVVNGKLDQVHGQVRTLSEQLRNVPKYMTQQIAASSTKFDAVHAEIGKLAQQLRAIQSSFEGDAEPATMEGIQIQTMANAKEAVAAIGKAPTATKLAEVLATIDTWTVQPDEEKAFGDYKLNVAIQLRQKVREEVAALQKAALATPTSSEGVKKHSEAGAVLSLYPMSEETTVLEEAKKLAGQQAELAVRLEVLRRQRYNHWAAQQIEKAIDGYNENKSYWSPKKENPLLVASLVETLAHVDPVHLEPVVLELYNYVVDLTKGSISEADRTELANRMSDPSIKRKTLGDF